MKRLTFMMLGVLCCTLAWSTTHKTSSESIISFADSSVKNVCVTHWDTDGDGELSEAEAAAVTNIGTVFYQNRNIKSFNELRYFTSLTTIPRNAFYQCMSLETITLPETITYIANYAFMGCSGLTGFIIPDAVTSIGENAFSGCTSLTTITIPENVISMAGVEFANCTNLTSATILGKPSSLAGTFSGCSKLEQANIPESVVTMKTTFYGCTNLKSVSIPKSVTSIGSGSTYSLSGCYNLTKIEVEEGNTVFDSREDCNALIKTSSNELLSGCRNTVIPATVQSISSQAFYNVKGLREITIPASVTSIGTNAFQGCSDLNQITSLISNPFSISAFDNTVTSTATLIVPQGCREAYTATSGWSDFLIYEQGETIRLKNYTDEQGVKYTLNADGESYSVSGYDADLLVADVVIPASIQGCPVTSITSFAPGRNASNPTAVKTITLPSSLTSITGSFRYCENLTCIYSQIEVPFATTAISWTNTVLVVPIGTRSDYKSVTGWKDAVTFEEGETVYDKTATDEQGIKYTLNQNSTDYSVYYSTSGHTDDLPAEIVIPDAIEGCPVTTISRNSFNDCTNLTKVTFSAGLTSINFSAFSGCIKLKEFVSLITQPTWSSVDKEIYERAHVIIPAGTLEAYLAVGGWNSFLLFEEGQEVVDYERTLTDEQGLTYQIAQNKDTFYYALTGHTEALADSVTIPEKLNGLPVTSGYQSYNYVFKDCTNLKWISIPQGFANPYGGWSNYFSGCSGLTVALNQPKVEGWSGNDFLSAIELGEGVDSLEYNAFNGCKNLTTVSMSSHLSYMGTYAFYGCTSLENIILPQGITEVPSSTFNGCSALSSISIPKGVTTIGSDAFSGCTALTAISLPDSITLGSYAFKGCTGLTAITIPRGASFGRYGYPFQGCTGIKEVNWLAATFYDWFPTAEKLYLGADVSELDDYNSKIISGTNLTSIVVDAANPIFDSRDSCNAIMRTAINTLVAGCAATIIPETTTSIGQYAFNQQTALTSVSIPMSVSSIGGSAFAGCTSLVDVYCYRIAPPSIGWRTFDAIKAHATLHVPFATTAKYLSAGWDFENIVEMEQSDEVVTTITLDKTRTEGQSTIIEYLQQFPDLQTVIVEEGNPKYSSNHGLLCTVAGDTLLYVPPMTPQLSADDVLTIPEGIHYLSNQAFPSFNYKGCRRLELQDSISYASLYWFREASLKNAVPPTLEYANDNKVLYVPAGSGQAYYDTYPNCIIIEESQPIERANSNTYNMITAFDINGDGEMELAGCYSSSNYVHTSEGTRYPGRFAFVKNDVEILKDSLLLSNVYDISSFEVMNGNTGLNYETSNQSSDNQKIYIFRHGDDGMADLRLSADHAYAADVDNDGRRDLAVSADNSIIIYTQQPDGSYIPTLQTVTEEEKEVEGGGGTWISFIRSFLRAGMFVDARMKGNAPMQASASGSVQGLQMMDLNSDGVLDFVQSGSVYHSLSQPDSYFRMEAAQNVFPYDIDGDGVVDYVCYDGTRLYIVTDILDPDSEPNQLYSNTKIDNVIFRDFDHDGDIDILAFLCTGGNSYFVFLRNNGDGTFRRLERNFAEVEYTLSECRDYDADGCYELLLRKKISYNDNQSVLKKVNNDFSLSDMDFSFEYPYNIGDRQYKNNDGAFLGDFSNDGLTEFYTFGGKFYGHLTTQTKANTAPLQMAKPTALLQTETGRLKISWQRGQDAETSACDLTYELRIGTQPGQGDVLRAQSLPDGRRLTTREGNQGTMLSTLFNAAALAPGTYYIAVQAIDQGGLGGAFSDELVYEHEVQAPVFALSSSNITTADTLTAYIKALAPGATYQWTLSEGEVISQQDGMAQIVFHQQGDHEIGLTMTLDGTQYQAQPLTAYASSMKYLNTYGNSYQNPAVPFLDFNQDGLLDGIGYKGMPDGTMEQILLSTFADMNGRLMFVTDLNRDGFPDFTMRDNSKGDAFLNYGEQDYDFDYQTVGISTNSYGSNMTDLNNDGLLDYNTVSGYSIATLYTTTDGINYEEQTISLGQDVNSMCLYDVNRDGFLDIVYYTNEYSNGQYTNNRFYCRLKDNTADFTYGEPQVLFELPDGDYIRNYILSDFNNDGCADLAVLYNESLYVYKGLPGGNSTEVACCIEGIKKMGSKAQDVNNDGCLDIPYVGRVATSYNWISGYEYKQETLLFKPDFGYELVEAETNWKNEEAIVPFGNEGHILAGTELYKSGIRNEAPQAPATVAAKQTKDGLLITWSDAEDKETLYAQMRYNVSVKRKDKTGANSFVISPLNGLKDEAAIVPGYEYKKSTQMLVPATVLTAGETYEIQVQSIDLWGAHSPMTAPVEFTMGAGGYLDVAERVATGREATVKYIGSRADSYSLACGEDGTIINNVSDGEYIVRWSTPGVKQLTLTAGTETITSSITVVDPVDLLYTLPDVIYAGAPISFRLSDDMAADATSTVRAYYTRVLAHFGGGQPDVTKDYDLGLTYDRSSGMATVTFPDTGTFYIETASADPVRGGTQLAEVTVTEVMPEARISRVDWDSETNRYAVQWNSDDLPDDISRVVVLKEGSSLNQFIPLDTVSMAQGFYIDAASQPSVHSERYKLQLVADNGQVSLPGVAHRPLHIMLLSSGGAVNLLWDKYEGIDVDNYRIWRYCDANGWELLAQMAGSQQSYTDLTYQELSGKVYYSVSFSPVATANSRRRAPEADGIPEGDIRSNVVSSAGASEAILAQSIAVQCYDDNLTLSDAHQQLQLYAIVKPLSATVSQVEWSVTEGANLLNVDANGRVTILPTPDGGTATVQARTMDGSDLKATIDITVTANGAGRLTFDLAEGWHWLSLNLDLDDLKSATTFIQPFGQSVKRLLSQTQELVYDKVYGWVGNLSALSPTESYRMQLSEGAAHTWTGPAISPADAPITLQRGWNWMGYVPTFAMTVDEALSGLPPQEGDCVLSQTDFAIYTDGAWVGDLTMQPGEGYLYQAGEPQTFYYPTGVAGTRPAASPNRAISLPEQSWQYDVHRYPDNMAVVCRVEGLEGETYTIGAFSEDGECRGVGKMVGDVIFLSIHGTLGMGESVSLRAYTPERDEEVVLEEQLPLNVQSIGTPRVPLLLHIQGAATALEQLADGAQPFDVYRLDGLKVASQRTSLKGLPKGTYIIRSSEGEHLVLKNERDF